MAKQICLPLLLLLIFFLPKNTFADTGIVINEITPTSSVGNDWVELYNSQDTDIDISNWILDDEGTSSDMLKIPQNTIMSTKSFKLFFVSNRLNKDGDTIYLKNQDIEVDKYQYPSSETDVSYARFPDGTGSWSTCSPTPESTNTNCQIMQSPSPEVIAQSPSSQPSTNQSVSNQITKPKTSPSPSPIKSSFSISPKPLVLGQKQQSSPPVSGSNESSSSPLIQSRDEQSESPNKIKLAALFAGSGLMTMGSATGAYLWYHKNKEKKNKDQQKESAN